MKSYLFSYSDINQSFLTNKIYDLDSVKQSILNILLTRKGTRIFNSQFGSNLEDYLFEIQDEATEFAAKNEVIRAINKWEKRVELDTMNTTVARMDSHTYLIKLVYIVKGTNTNSKFEFKVTK